MKRSTFLSLALGVLGFSSLTAPVTAADDAKIYEMRIYVTKEGKLDALLSRFRDHACKLFEKYGVENIGYWVPVEKEDGADNTLIYVVAHKSREAAKDAWNAFREDPEWKAARAASEANGKILEKAEVIFMTPTEYSPPVKLEAAGKDRVFEMRTYNTPAGKLDDLHNRFKNHTINLFTKYGMSHIGYWVPTDAEKGAGTKLIYILSHASKEAGLASFTAFRKDPDWVKAKAESEKGGGSLTLPQPDGVKSVYMRATDFSPIR